MARFSETPLFILKNYFNSIISTEEEEYSEYTAASSSGGYLFRPNSSLIARDLILFEFYAKNEDSDYKKIKADIQSDWDSEENKIVLHKLLSPYINPTSDVKRTIEESGYRRVTYNAIDVDQYGYRYQVEQGDGIYIRKDNNFITWVDNNSDSYDGYISTEKPYIYIGNGYQFQDSLVKIYYYALKDWMKDALPVNNRTDKFSEFIELIYDRFYSKLYNMQKELLSLIDPKEVDLSLLGELYTYYGVEPLFSTLDEYKRRLFVDNLIYFLKKKGTYSSVYIIGNILSANTENELTIYDRWHDTLPTSGDISPYYYFEDYPYVDYYTGNLYPTNYELSDPEETEYTISPFSLETLNDLHNEEETEKKKILSTHYKVEFDLNHNPMQDEYILSKELAKDLGTKWESTRPVNKVSHYHILLNPPAQFATGEVKLYDNPLYSANMYSMSAVYVKTVVNGAYIHLQILADNRWEIIHNLGTEYIIVDAYNIRLEKIHPRTIKVINENKISLYFEDENLSGVAIIAAAEYHETENSTGEGTVDHDISNKYIIPQFYDLSLIQSKPLEIELLDSNRLKLHSSGPTHPDAQSINGTTTVIDADYLHTQGSASKTGEVNHNLGYNGIVASVYDKNGYKIIPEDVKLTSDNKCTITFWEAIEGYAAIKKVGIVNPSPTPEDFDGDWYVKIGSGENLDAWDFEEENDIKSEDYKVWCNINNFEASSEGYRFDFNIPRLEQGYITEMGIFDINENIVIYSKLDNLYKHKDFIIDTNYLVEY